MSFSRRGFAQMLGLFTGAAASAGAVELQERSIVEPALGSGKLPSPPPALQWRPVLLVYKPWAVCREDVQGIIRSLQHTGVWATAVPTQDKNAPDIRFFDMDKAGVDGALEQLEAIKSDMFARRPQEPGDVHELGMQFARLVKERLKVKVAYDDTFKVRGASLGSSVNRRVDQDCIQTISLDSFFHRGIKPTSWESRDIDYVTKVWLESAADDVAASMNLAGGDLVTVDLPIPSGVYGAAAVDFGGLAARAVRYYDHERDQFITRLDILAGRADGQPCQSGTGMALYFAAPRYDSWPVTRA